jgi:hypothetical protein
MHFCFCWLLNTYTHKIPINHKDFFARLISPVKCDRAGCAELRYHAVFVRVFDIFSFFSKRALFPASPAPALISPALVSAILVI